MDKSTALLVAQIAIPALCVVGGGVAISRQVGRAADIRQETGRVERQIVLIEERRRELEKPRAITRYPTVLISEKEQPDFLSLLRLCSGVASVKISRWANGTPISALPPGTPLPNNASQTPALLLASQLPPGVTAIPSSIEVTGKYNDVRQFLYLLMRESRLLNLSDLKWQRTDKWPSTRANFNLTRYVTSKPPAAPPGQEIASAGRPTTSGPDLAHAN